MSDEKKYAGLAKLILQHIGGPSNVADYTQYDAPCASRLSTVKKPTSAQSKRLKA
jgi:phosphotransferase system IIB component